MEHRLSLVHDHDGFFYATGTPGLLLSRLVPSMFLDVQDVITFWSLTVLMVLFISNLSLDDRLFAAFLGFTKVQTFRKLLLIQRKCLHVSHFAHPENGNGGWNDILQILPFIQPK
jgi:hypothetical protein